METPHISTRTALNRRHFLRGTGAAALSLPFLEAMSPAFARAAAPTSPNRFVAMCAGLGFHAPYLFPTKTGFGYEDTPYLAKLKSHRDKFTVFSGLSHPSQQGNNGHASSLTWLTSAKRPGLAGFKNTISIDQLIANQIGIETRFPYLALSMQGGSLSWTATGVEIPSQTRPSKLFKTLFVDGTAEEVSREMRELQRGRSIMDTVLGEAKKLDRELGKHDREKLEEYLTSVRELEARLQQSEGWAQKPKPKVDAKVPTDIADKNDVIGKQRLMFDMIALALQTDSTRTVTLQLGSLNAPPSNIAGVSTDWHNLSHHGKDEAKIEELKLVEEAEFAALGDFLSKLDSLNEDGKTVLDRTSVLYGSNLGNASSHSSRNLPIIVAGGGFKHGQHLAHDEKDNTEFANLFVQLGQRMGLEIDQFGSSTKTGIDGFELA